MKSVLISIQPKWCELIANGKKTIEVRKTAPKLETPFKCYIYCTKNNSERLLGILKDGDENYGSVYHGKTVFIKGESGSVCDMYNKRQKVIGEFVCDNIEMVNAQCSDMGIDLFYHDCEKYGCLSQVEVEKYFGVYDEERIKDLRSMKGKGYAWHISDLKIYDKPKELGEFYCKANCDYVNTGYCKVCTDNCKYHKGEFYHSITRPQQSWCYVEEL